jgi:undecaprenyl-diphosphatase
VDWTVLKALNGMFYHHDAIEDPVVAYVNAAEALFVAMLAVVLAVSYGRRRASWRRAAVAAGLSAGLAFAVGKAISVLVDRPRPFVAHPSSVHLFAPHAADAGFPSDHATASFAIAVAIILRKRVWGAVVLLAAIVLCVGRVAIGVHYPSDVLGGAILGALAALLLWWGPVRSRLDRLSDAAGGIWDRAADWLVTRARAGFRPSPK